MPPGLQRRPGRSSNKSARCLRPSTRCNLHFRPSAATYLTFKAALPKWWAGAENVLKQIALAQKQAVGGILVRDGVPIWSPDLWLQTQTTLLARFRGISSNCWDDIQQYLTTPSMGMPLHVGLFIALTLLMCAAHRRVDRWKASGDSISSAAAVFRYPYSAALIGSMLVATGPVSPTPQTVKSLFEIAALAPMIRLAQPAVDHRVIPGLYALAILFSIDIVRTNL